jgi:Flp pilus assembly pilin Flp
MMRIKNKRGQSTVEYVLLVTAVIAVIIALVTSNNSGLQGQLNSTLNGAIDQVGNMSDRLTGSEAPSPSNATAPSNPYTLNAN